MVTKVAPPKGLGHKQARSLALVAAGAVLGVTWWLIAPTAYTAEARLAVGEQSLSAVQVPGYVSATQSLASDYARYVQDSTGLREELRVDSGDVTSISASPIPESSIIRVEVQARTAAAAAGAANAVADRLLQQVEAAGPGLEAAQQRFVEAHQAYQRAQAEADGASSRLQTLTRDGGASDSEVDAAQADADETSARAAILDLEQQALGAVYRESYSQAETSPSLSIVAEAVDASSDAWSRLQRALLIGVLAGAAAAWGYNYWRKNWRERDQELQRKHSADRRAVQEVA